MHVKKRDGVKRLEDRYKGNSQARLVPMLDAANSSPANFPGLMLARVLGRPPVGEFL